MDDNERAEELASQQRAIRTSYVKLHRVNGRTLNRAPFQDEDSASSDSEISAGDNGEAEHEPKPEPTEGGKQDPATTARSQWKPPPRVEHVMSGIMDPSYPCVLAVISPAAKNDRKTLKPIVYASGTNVSAPDINFPALVMSEAQMNKSIPKKQDREFGEDMFSVCYNDIVPQTDGDGGNYLLGLPEYKNTSRERPTIIEIPTRARANSLPTYNPAQLRRDIREQGDRPKEVPLAENDVSPPPPAKYDQSITRVFLADSVKRLAEYKKAKKGLYVPTDKELITSWHIMRKRRPETYQEVNDGTLGMLRYTLRFMKGHWGVSGARLKRILGHPQHVTSMGSIPFMGSERQAEELRQQELEMIRAAAASKDPEDPSRKREREKKAQREQEKLDDQAKKEGTYRIGSLAARVEEKRKTKSTFEQNTNTRVTMQLYDNKDMTSYIQFNLLLNHIDPSKPDKQPFEQAKIILTGDNCRLDEPEVQGRKQPYEKSHVVIDMSAEKMDAQLQDMFPHLPAGYFAMLRKKTKTQKRQRVLIYLHHNRHHYTSNILVDNPIEGPGLSPTHASLRTAMPLSPMFCVLVWADLELITKQLNAIVKRWEDVWLDKYVRFFKSPTAMYINPKNMASIDDIPKTIAKYEPTHATPRDYRYTYGLGNLLEHAVAHNVGIGYCGEATFVPVPMTYDVGLQRSWAYFMQVALDKDSMQLPKLTEGDQIVMALGHHVLSQVSFKGKIISPTPITGMDMLSAVIYRPVNEEGVVDMTQFTQLDSRQVDAMASDELQKYLSNTPKTLVTLRVKPDTKEAKRQSKALAKMFMTYKERRLDPVRAAVLEDFQLFFTCKNHQELSRTSIYAQLDPETKAKYVNIVFSRLTTEQRRVVTYWDNGGIRAGTACVGGVSGSGKSYLALWAASALLGKVAIPADRHRRQHRITMAFLKDGKLDEAEKVDENEYPLPESTETVLVQGKLLLLAAQNVTADKLHQDAKHILSTAHALANPTAAPLLGFRAHSRPTEMDATVKLADPDVDHLEDSPLLRDTTQFTGELSQTLLATFNAQQQGSKYRGIRDERFQHAEDSGAWYILQLAGVKPMSLELAAKFELAERRELEDQLWEIKDAVDLFLNNERWTKDMIKAIKRSAKEAYKCLIQVADFITTTQAVAHDPAMIAMRYNSAIVIEEASRLNDAQLWAAYSQHWMTPVRILVGDYKQLPPPVFGPAEDNNFQTTIKVPLLMRLKQTGYRFHELKTTRRFRNEEALKLCQIANEDDSIRTAPGSGDTQAEAQAKCINNMLYGIRAATIFVDMQKTHPRKDASHSTFNVDTAIAVMHDIEKRVEMLQNGKQVKVITPYKAQIALYEALRFNMLQKLRRADKPIAQYIEDVEFETIDQFQGNQGDHVIVDTACVRGHLMQTSRSVVAFTRHRDCAIVIGDKWACAADDIRKTHPVKATVFHMNDDGKLFELTEKRLKKYDQFPEVMQGLGLAA